MASGAVDAQAIVDRAATYIAPGNTKYAYLSLVTLMPTSLFRSYQHYYESGRIVTQGLGSFLKLLSNLVDLLDPRTADSEMKVRRGKQTLTCSEFVYRCYKESGTNIEVARALNDWNSPTRAAVAVGEPDIADTLGVVDGVNLIQFHESLVSAVTATRSGGSRAVRDQEAELKELALRSAEVTRAVISHNSALGKYGDADDGAEPHVRDDTDRSIRSRFSRTTPGTVVADNVTPRDLWSSPSLKVCSVLHRPPNTDSDFKLDFSH